MSELNFGELRQDLHWLSAEDGVVPVGEAVDVLHRILTALLGTEGLSVHGYPSYDLLGRGPDLLAFTNSDRDDYSPEIAIDYNHHGGGKPSGIEELDLLLVKMGRSRMRRAMLISRFGFTDAAIEYASSKEPIGIELMDLGGIDAWIRRLEIGKPDYSDTVQLLIKAISHEFAILVSKSPEAIDYLEWRDLERMMARVMEGLGFECRLTPASKDGGKDLVLTWRASSGDQSFIIELKHWRSGKRVGKTSVSDFMKVIIEENREGGLFLSTSGYAANRSEGITEFTRDKLWFGEKSKIVLLATTYIRAFNGLWSPPSILPEVLFEGTEPA